MTIKDLSYFLQVCRSGSINGAARSLYISAQGLSRILKNLEDELGYEDVDEAVNTYSHGALEHVSLYSILEDPMTSCGCFECICGIEPMSGGVVIVNREHTGMTPLEYRDKSLAS